MGARAECQRHEQGPARTRKSPRRPGQRDECHHSHLFPFRPPRRGEDLRAERPRPPGEAGGCGRKRAHFAVESLHETGEDRGRPAPSGWDFTKSKPEAGRAAIISRFAPFGALSVSFYELSAPFSGLFAPFCPLLASFYELLAVFFCLGRAFFAGWPRSNMVRIHLHCELCGGAGHRDRPSLRRFPWLPGAVAPFQLPFWPGRRGSGAWSLR